MDAYIDWLAERELTASSRRAYGAEVARLQRHLALRCCELRDVDSEVLGRFWTSLQRGRWHETRQPPAVGSLMQSRRIVAAFLRWAAQHGYVEASCLLALREWRVGVTPAAPTPTTRPLPPAGLRLLLNVIDLDGVAAALCFWAGATPRELSELRLVDIDVSACTVRLSGRSRPATVAIPKTLARSLTKRLPATGPFVFGGPDMATAAALSQRVRRWARAHGFGPAGSARDLRARFQTLAHAAGWSGEEIRAQLRRSSLPIAPAASPSRRRLEGVVHAA